MATFDTRPVIELKGLKKNLGGKDVLRGIDLEIRKGETLVIIGRSGEGKSVLLKHIVGLFQPDEGEILFEGDNIAGLNEREMNRYRERIGMLFQGSALFDSMTVLENVGFALYEQKEVDRSEIEKRVVENLKLVRLEDILEKKPAELSGGMKKRVGLARAIINRPSVMLYDEPTTGLDPITADAINDLILMLQEKLEVSSVAVTHDLASARKIANRIAMLHEGRIIAVCPVEEIDETENEHLRQFVEGSAKGPIKV